MRSLRDEFSVEIADTPALVEEAYRLRYQTYCVERGYEASATGLEIDAFDHRARHAVLRHLPTDQMVGTVRLVLPCPHAPEDSFPMQQLCDSRVLQQFPLATTAEISRFALPKRLRDIGGASASLMRLGLMRGIVQISQEFGLTHWCAVMERSLLRLLQSSAIHFHPAGPLVEHHGLRQPSIGNIDGILTRMRHEQAAIWDFITDGGRLWESDEAVLTAA